MPTILTKDFLVSYFSGNTTAMQKKLVEEWLQDAGNVEFYYECLEEWEREQPQFLPDEEAALEKSTKRIYGSDNREISIKSASRPLRKQLGGWWKVAAVLAGLAMLSYSFRDYLLYRSYETAYGELRTVILDDNSQVELNANSVLRVPRWDFGSGNRNVFLEGEAEFAVRHTFDNKRFIVHALNQSEVMVLGTEFVVYSRQQGTKVVLNKGKVQLTTTSHRQPLVMQPGDKANILQNGEIELEKLTAVQLENHIAWKDHRFVFENTNLRQITLKIKEVFGIQVLIQDSLLAQRELTGSFKAQNIDELLLIISETLSIDIARQDDQLLFIPKPAPAF